MRSGDIKKRIREILSFVGVSGLSHLTVETEEELGEKPARGEGGAIVAGRWYISSSGGYFWLYDLVNPPKKKGKRKTVEGDEPIEFGRQLDHLIFNVARELALDVIYIAEEAWSQEKREE